MLPIRGSIRGLEFVDLAIYRPFLWVPSGQMNGGKSSDIYGLSMGLEFVDLAMYRPFLWVPIGQMNGGQSSDSYMGFPWALNSWI